MRDENTKDKKGFFITLEGIDGSGKTLAAEKLAKYLSDAGHHVLLTREPGGSDIGREIRQMLLHSTKKTDPLTEMLLFSADRAEHVASCILPALNEGAMVISDRFTDSTVAYQGGGRGFSIEQINILNNIAARGLKPNLTFYLSVTQETAMTRRKAVADRMEQEDLCFYNQVIALYDSLAAAEPERIKTIDANAKPNQVFEAILRHLPPQLKNHS